MFLHSWNVKHFDLTHRKNPIGSYHCSLEWTWEQWQQRGTTHSLKLQSLIIRLFNVLPCCILTESSCSGCVNRKAAIHGCKQITWVDNWKLTGIVKSYMQTPTAVMVSLAVDNQKRFRHSRSPVSTSEWPVSNRSGALTSSWLISKSAK